MDFDGNHELPQERFTLVENGTVDSRLQLLAGMELDRDELGKLLGDVDGQETVAIIGSGECGYCLAYDNGGIDDNSYGPVGLCLEF
jgi:hypothetical protein